MNLFDAIDDYASVPSNLLKHIEEPTVGSCCLAKYKNNFSRGKIIKICCGEDEFQPIVLVDVFFVDFGERMSVAITDILEIPKNIIEMTPFLVTKNTNIF